MQAKLLFKTLRLLRLAAGLILLAAFSWELLHGYERHFSTGYLSIQFIVCLFFLFDFFVGLRFAPRKAPYWAAHWPQFLLGIPWLHLMRWCGCPLSHEWAVAVGILPVLLLLLAAWYLISWIDSLRVHRLFLTYLWGVLLFTYLSALLFYDFEALINQQLHGFGNALWWAGLNLSTAGAPIVPVTVIGKILSVLLPVAGMLFLPIFTTYILQYYNRMHGGPQTPPNA